MNESFAGRFEQVRGRIEAACARCGRSPEQVSLVAVSKGVPPEGIREAVECGIRVFGESRVQEARQKIPMCPSHIEWHMVGHLQTNKVGLAVELFRMVHSVDSPRLLDAINGACEHAGVSLPVLLEVNVSGEGAKFGMTEVEAASALAASRTLPRVEVSGLMTIPPLSEDPEDTRPFFRRLRELRDRLGTETGTELRELSMGMSSDFEVAIEEGSTRIRVGAALFGRRGERK